MLNNQYAKPGIRYSSTNQRQSEALQAEHFTGGCDPAEFRDDAVPRSGLLPHGQSVWVRVRSQGGS